MQHHPFRHRRRRAARRHHHSRRVGFPAARGFAGSPLAPGGSAGQPSDHRRIGAQKLRARRAAAARGTRSAAALAIRPRATLPSAWRVRERCDVNAVRRVARAYRRPRPARGAVAVARAPPSALSIDETIRDIAAHDPHAAAHDRAIRASCEVVAAGLAHRHDGLVFATVAAVRFHELQELG
jgi:hypothetical protein